MHLEELHHEQGQTKLNRNNDNFLSCRGCQNQHQHWDWTIKESKCQLYWIDRINEIEIVSQVKNEN